MHFKWDYLSAASFRFGINQQTFSFILDIKNKNRAKVHLLMLQFTIKHNFSHESCGFSFIEILKKKTEC